MNTKQGLQLQLEEILPYLNKTRGPDKNGWYTALCPFHDDQHKPNLRFTDKGFQCMTCGEKGSLQKLAGRLGLKPEFKLIKTSRRIDSLYAYKDRDGNLIYQVVRYKPKSFGRYLPKDGIPSVTSVTDSFEPIVKCEPNSSVTNIQKEPNVTENSQSYANRNVTLVTDKASVSKKVEVEEGLSGQFEDTSCEVLDEWRRSAIPAWRRILAESISQGDTKREEYARKMLQEVLKDPEYKEVKP